MGVLNVTPDSFSDGGLYDTLERAVARGLEMVAEGADVIDVGGESSRPGAEPVPVEVELARVVPVVEALARSAAAGGVRVSVDTVKPEVAEAAVSAGASLVNDISASLWEVAASSGAGWVAMHMQGRPRTMQDDPSYEDVVAEVGAFVLERAARALAAGVREVWVDPGIGFGKTIGHNLSLLRHLPELVAAAEDAGCAGVAGGVEPQALPRCAGERAGGAPGAPGGARGGAGRGLAGDGGGGHGGRGRHGPGPRRGGDGAGGAAVWSCRMKGKWAAGIPPRNFTWVIKDHLAVSERPGGFSVNHRRVRRQEEIIWLRVQGFGRVISLLPSPHNLAAYEEEGLAWAHYPLERSGDPRPVLAGCYRDIDDSLAAGLRILVHQDELGDRVMGVVAGYLVWSDRIANQPQAVALVEHVCGHAMGEPGRELLSELEGMPSRGQAQ